MATWPLLGAPPCVTITPWSMESLGPLLRASAQSSINNTGSATYPSANLAIFIPFRIYVPCVIVKMLAYVGGTNGNNIDVGIYSVDGTKLVSSGSTALGTINVVQSFDITDTTLVPGLYFMAVAMNNTTGTLQRIAPTAAFVRAFGLQEMATAFALPAVATFAANATSNYIPVIGVSTRVLV